MSLLNITSDGLPNILVVLHAAVLRSSKPIPEADLLEAVAPAAIIEDDAVQVRNTLNRWTDLGLFTRQEGLISVQERFGVRKASSSELMAFTRRIACRRVMDEENNPDLWASKGARAADLTRSLAWMLAQDVYRTSFSGLATLEAQQFSDPERLLLKNDTRVTGLKFWAPFLGFSREPFAVIDPTVAVRDVLPEILQPGDGIPAVQFIERLNMKLPVLDGGRWQLEVMDAIDPQTLPKKYPGQVSSALSRALINLWHSRELNLETKADFGDSIILTGVAGMRSDMTFQWVTRPQVEV